MYNQFSPSGKCSQALQCSRSLPQEKEVVQDMQEELAATADRMGILGIYPCESGNIQFAILAHCHSKEVFMLEDLNFHSAQECCLKDATVHLEGMERTFASDCDAERTVVAWTRPRKIASAIGLIPLCLLCETTVLGFLVMCAVQCLHYDSIDLYEQLCAIDTFLKMS